MNTKNALVPVEPVPVEPLTPGYYERVVAGKEDYYGSRWHIGDLAYLVRQDGTKLTVVAGESTWTFDEAEFRTAFRPAPDGRARRNAQRDALLADIDTLGSEEDLLTDALARFNPHASEGSDSTALVVQTGATAAKRTLAQVRNNATRLRRDLVEKQTALKRLAEEQALILREKANALQGFLNKAEEAIWTINLYLGTNEEIAKIADGQPAAADVPITIRQLVLFMDEECAVNAEGGGIDFSEIDAFDRWLTADPAHVVQVLPEQRGIVALKPRRRRKDYGDTSDPWVAAQRDKANRKTYFLIRNGGLLYRMWTSYEVGEHLVPRSDEFMRVFVDRRYNFQTREDEEIILEPGTDAYMAAEKKAEGKQRHYMRAALVLQGLIDRTTVFRPLKWDPIRVNDYNSYGEALNLVLDADVLLGDGRERFVDWQARINSELTVGQRVVGTWDNWEHGLRREEGERHEGNRRLSPRGAEYPATNALYTIEGRRDKGLLFYYKRHEANWRSWENEGYTRRAACTVYPDDRFILNFDAANEDDLRFFLESRADRPDYMFMLPLIRYTLEQKALEREAEAPFRLLLAGQIAQAYPGVSIPEAEAALDELVPWWKFKNRTHRALTSDDALALRMIVTEFGHRQEQAADLAERPETPAVVAAIRAAHPDVLLIAHKAGSEYVALVPANEQNLFVHEEIWSKRKGVKERREWRTVDKRYLRWRVLEASPRWEDWQIGASPIEHLTDPERDRVVAAAWRQYQDWHPAVRLLALGYRNERVDIFGWEPEGDPPAAEYVHTVSAGWRRDSGYVRPVMSRYDDHRTNVEAPWQAGYDGHPYEGIILERDEAEMAAFRAAREQHRANTRAENAIRNRALRAAASVQKQLKKNWEAEQYAKFLADYGDADLWEGHRKTLQEPNFDTGPLFMICNHLLLHTEEPLDGRTVGELQVAALKAGWPGRTDLGDVADAIAGFVVSDPQTENDDEDDDD